MGGDGGEPVVKMGFGLGVLPVVAAGVALATVVLLPIPAGESGVAAESIRWGVLAGGLGSVFFPIASLIVGRAKVTYFAGAVFAASTLHMSVAAVAAIVGLWLVEQLGGEPLDTKLFQIGAIVAALLGLTAETLAAVAVLRPTWDLADSAGSPDAGAWKSGPNGPTTRPEARPKAPGSETDAAGGHRPPHG